MINILQQSVEKFIRTYFFNKRDEDYAYLLDQAVGLEGYIAFPILLQCNWWDAYRPQQTVDHFVRRAQDLDDQKIKEHFYPDVDKSL